MRGCDSSFQGAEYFWPEENCFLVTTRDLEHHLQKKTSSSFEEKSSFEVFETEVEQTQGWCCAIRLLMCERSRASSCNDAGSKDRHFRSFKY